MKNFTTLLFSFGLILFFSSNILAQQETPLEKSRRMTEESRYLSPIRYVIVYNDIIKLAFDQRRIEILMEESQYNEENLRKVFDLVKTRFPSPIALSIEIHTSLETIETPEEREKADSSSGRFPDETAKYKKANYYRYCGGGEAFSYINESQFARKVVVLVDKPLCRLQ
ncbi:MAG: hypothetical protein LH614_10240 [Pyrinomonadaceae bacterium]|nr:hypothetical protein [Pyrinomonadaceae bacterium]